MQSMTPFYQLLRDGLIDRNVQFVAALDGLAPPAYFDWLMAPLTKHKVCGQPWPPEVHSRACPFVIPFLEREAPCIGIA